MNILRASLKLQPSENVSSCRCILKGSFLGHWSVLRVAAETHLMTKFMLVFTAPESLTLNMLCCNAYKY